MDETTRNIINNLITAEKKCLDAIHCLEIASKQMSNADGENLNRSWRIHRINKTYDVLMDKTEDITCLIENIKEEGII